jgi:hypothetical protein
MKYSKKLLVTSMKYVMPHLQERYVLDGELQDFIEGAAVEYFLKDPDLTQDEQHGRYVVKCALVELQQTDSLAFGSVDDHWM